MNEQNNVAGDALTVPRATGEDGQLRANQQITHEAIQHNRSGDDRAAKLDTVKPSLEKKARKRRLTRTDKEALTAKILALLKGGHPIEAVALICGESESVIRNIVTTLLMEGKFLEPPKPLYALMPSGKMLKEIAGLNVPAGSFVRITPHENGAFLLEHFNAGE